MSQLVLDMIPVDIGVEGCRYYPEALCRDEQTELVKELRTVLKRAPLFQPTMPRTDKPLSVRMSNCGPLGWVADKKGYRYQRTHPVTGKPWPEIPKALFDLWERVAKGAPKPQACLINWYAPDAKMGLHQDRDEETFDAPVVSVSLGDDAMFRMGGVERGGKTTGIRLKSGDVLVFGGPSRLAYHGITKIYDATSDLLDAPGRVNLTLRRVTPA
ncbi:MAG: alpha-ketoglutarate-dependent dioxygenase AlkB [Pseudomonadota bacterium]